MSIEDAVRLHVDVGDTLYIDQNSQAGIRGLIRTFAGRDAGFHIVCYRGGEVVPDLVALGLISHLTTSSLASRALPPHRIATLQRAFATDTLQLSSWSLHSLTLRLMAAALRWPLVPVPMMSGTTMAIRNFGALATVENPFTHDSLLVATPLPTDLAIVHALLSDSSGHAVVLPPSAEGGWAARSASRGVIVTAEHIVDSATVRRHPTHRLISPHRVLAVCPAEFGSHPYELLAGIPGLVTGYAADSHALAEYSGKLEEPHEHLNWVREVVLGTKDEEKYRARFPAARFRALRSTFAAEFQRGRRQARESKPKTPNKQQRSSSGRKSLASLAPDSRIALTGARRIVERVAADHIRTLLVGTGLPQITCAVASYLMRQQGLECQLVIGTGVVDFAPGLGRRAYQLGSAGCLTTGFEVYGVMLGGQDSRSLGVLSAAQIDLSANLNDNEIENGRQILTGAGGATDAAALAAEVLVVARSRPGRFVQNVDFITCAGDRITSLVTEFGVFEKSAGNGQLRLTRRFLESEQVMAALVAQAPTWATDYSADLEEGATALEMRALNGVMLPEMGRVGV